MTEREQQEQTEERSDTEQQGNGHPAEPVEEEEAAQEAGAEDEQHSVPESGEEGTEEGEVDYQALYEELKADYDALNDKYLRLAAEFENFKKRSERDHSRRLQFANEEFFKDILPIMDDLERAVDSAQEDASFERLKEGIELVYDNFKSLLSQRGIEPIDSVGEPFDPEYHDAMMTRESDEYEPETVIDEFKRGYKMGDKVLRHAKVVVSK